MQQVAKEHGIMFKVIHIMDKESAQNVPAPVTTYALFQNGKFLTQSIQSDKKFLALAGILEWGTSCTRENGGKNESYRIYIKCWMYSRW